MSAGAAKRTAPKRGAKVRVASAARIAVDDCARCVLGSEPFVTYGYTRASCRRLVRRDGRTRFLVARVGGRVVGIAVYDPHFLNGAYLRLIAVDPTYRGRGVGAALMRALETAAGRAVYLCVTDFNRRAQAFYRRRGYQRVGILTDHAKPGVDEWLLRRLRTISNHHGTRLAGIH